MTLRDLEADEKAREAYKNGECTSIKEIIEEIPIKGFQYQYRWLSNFWPAYVQYDGVYYPTVEHAYMAAKSFDLEYRKKIAECAKPAQAKKLGRAVKLREDWEEVKRDIMKDLIWQKFNSEPAKAKLLNTKNAYLEETNAWNDTYWGVCNGVGRNELGKILMEIREELRGI